MSPMVVSGVAADVRARCRGCGTVFQIHGLRALAQRNKATCPLCGAWPGNLTPVEVTRFVECRP